MMKVETCRAIACAVMALLAGSETGAVGAAERYPSHPIRAIVPFAPGGATDIMARAISAKLSERLGQPISPMFLVTHPSVPAASYGELVALARAKPGQLNYASSGTGGASHLMMELFLSQTGLKAVHIPYKGAAPALSDLIAGQVQVSLQQPPSAIPHLVTGKLRAHAVTSKRRIATASEVPTTAEVGLPQFDVTSWQGLVVPKGTPATVVRTLHSEIRIALGSRELQERLIAEGSEPGGVTPELFAEHIRREIARWAEVVKVSGYRPE